MLRLHDFLESGNGYKVRLALTQLGLPFERVEHDILAGATRTADFLASKNPNGRIPVLELEDGRVLAESNAILWYLGDGTTLVPEDGFERARVLQWMFFEQYSHEPYIATSRFLLHAKPPGPERDAELARRREGGLAALGVLERHLEGRSFLVADRYSIADIALYAYTHVAHEGGFDLEPFRHLRAWLRRVEARPGHIPITQG